MSWTMQDFSPCSVFVRAPLPPCQVKRYKCIGQIEASTSPPGHFTFLKIVVQILPYPSQNAVQKCPFRWSNAPTPGTFHRHMNDRRTENTPSVVELNIYIYSSLRASSPVWASRERASEGPILCHSRLRRSLARVSAQQMLSKCKSLQF